MRACVSACVCVSVSDGARVPADTSVGGRRSTRRCQSARFPHLCHPSGQHSAAMVPRRPSSWLAAACLLLSLQSVSFVAAVNYRHCSDKPLETREEEANVIFTGTIRNLYTDWDRPRLKRAQVEVKRVMKGRNVINKLPGAWPGNFWHRRIVTVDGIGDPHICDSRVRKYDTRIFMLGRGEHGELRLNSSLIRITLDNIKEADAAVRGTCHDGPSFGSSRLQCD